MTLGSLFTGIGGFDLAATWAGIDIVYQIEIDPFCNQLLEKRFPNVQRYNDITRIPNGLLPRTDIITGGFPCQPFSVAGKQRGKEDDRALWPHMLRIIKDTKPTWVIGENVPGIINMELDNILDDLEREGYTTQTLDIPAFAVGACHKRHRIWILAHSNKESQSRFSLDDKKMASHSKQSGWERVLCNNIKRKQEQDKSAITLDAQRDYFEQFAEIVGKPAVQRMDDGIPNRVDRLGAVGNAIVPQVAYILLSYIKELEITNE